MYRTWVAFDGSTSPLADVFGLPNVVVEKATAGVIGQLFGPEESGHHERDVRLMRRQFDDDHYFRLSSYWPKVDDLKFYQAIATSPTTAVSGFWPPGARWTG